MGIKIKDLTDAITIANPGGTDLPISTGGSTYKIQVQDIIDLVPTGITVVSGAVTENNVKTLIFTGSGNLTVPTADTVTVNIPAGGAGSSGIANVQVRWCFKGKCNYA